MATSIPAVLVGPLRQALVSQGFPPETISNDGTLNPAGLLAASYDTIELRSSVTPTVRIDMKELLKPGPRNPVLNLAKPTVIMSGSQGTSIIAPYGPAAGGGWVVPMFAVGLLIGIGFVLGRKTA